MTEEQNVAESALGKQAEVLAQGDLSRSGLEQVLVANPQANAQSVVAADKRSGALSIVRATVLEKRDGKWAEVLRCDERLKNPNGYLVGSVGDRVSGWRLEYSQDSPQGLEMKFTPDSGGLPAKTIRVEWNAGAKRFQSKADAGRFLNEAPTLETPMSNLK